MTAQPLVEASPNLSTCPEGQAKGAGAPGTFFCVAADLEIARMRMDQARDRLVDAVIAGDTAAEARLEKVHAAAIADYRDLKQGAQGA